MTLNLTYINYSNHVFFGKISNKQEKKQPQNQSYCESEKNILNVALGNLKIFS